MELVDGFTKHYAEIIKMSCCENLQWVYISDASHADGCESCDQHLINLYVSSFNNTSPFVPVSKKLADQIQSLKAEALKVLMRNWYNGLETTKEQQR